MAKRLAKPPSSTAVRLDWDDGKVRDMDAAAAHVGLSVASFARLALELLIEKKSVTLEEVREEATRLTSRDDSIKPPAVPAAKPRKGKA